MSTFCFRLLAASLLTLFALGARAQNYTYCVGSSAQLASALAAAQTVPGTTYILLQGSVGTATFYDVDLTYINAAGGLYLLGGYTDANCTDRVIGRAYVGLEGGGKSGNVVVNGNLRVEGITFENFGSGLDFGSADNSPQGISLSLVNDAFSHTRVSVNTGLSASQQSIRVLDSSFFNSPSYGLGVGAWDNSIQVTITGNTVRESFYEGMSLCLFNGTASLYNNIVWGNHGYDVNAMVLDPSGTSPAVDCPNSGGVATIYMDHNIYGANMLNGNLSAGSNHNLNSDPLFDGIVSVDPGSPAVNAGNPAAPYMTTVDVIGGPRVIGSAPDIGAYESAVNDIAPTTLTVTRFDDGTGGSTSNCNSGSLNCTLRQAITDANSSGGTHYIEFDTNGTCPQVIDLYDSLPTITAPGLSINGFSQNSGGRSNTAEYGDNALRCIVLNGRNLPNISGLVFYGASSAFYWVQGLSFEGFTSAALNMSAGQNNLVRGNQFGGQSRAGNFLLAPNAIDVWLWGATTITQVGGIDVADRNVIASADPTLASGQYSGSGIAISAAGGSKGNSIVGNLIGMDYAESTTAAGGGKVGTAVGIQLETANNIISDNAIGNSNNGIQVLGGSAQNNQITSNRIGLSNPYCFFFNSSCIWFDGTSLPNQAGIYFWQGANTNEVFDNTIEGNTLFGVEMTGAGTYRNRLSHNRITGNPASWASGAELNLDGYAYGYNDPNSSAPNRGLNHPIIASVVGGPSVGTISGHLDSSNGLYGIEVFSSPTCENGGSVAHSNVGFLGGLVGISGAPVGQNGSGNFAFDFTSPVSLSGRYITATVTDSNGNTSEFSGCSAYQCDVIFRHGFDTATGEKCP